MNLGKGQEHRKDYSVLWKCTLWAGTNEENAETKLKMGYNKKFYNEFGQSQDKNLTTPNCTLHSGNKYFIIPYSNDKYQCPKIFFTFFQYNQQLIFSSDSISTS